VGGKFPTAQLAIRRRVGRQEIVMSLSPLSLWLVLILGGLITFAIRLSFIVLLGRYETPSGLQRALRYVPPAVLSAIILPELIMQDGAPSFALSNVRLLAGLLATLIAWKTRNAIITVIVGMAALWILQAL
jgi:branched-subunit amino acid transport protein